MDMSELINGVCNH